MTRQIPSTRNLITQQQARRVYGKIFDSFTRAKTIADLLKAVQASEAISSCLSANDLAALESYGNKRANMILAERRSIDSIMRNNRAVAYR